MKQKMRAIILTLGIITSLATAATAVSDPWRLLASIEIKEVIDGDHYAAIKTYPPALLETADTFLISGYVVPVTAEPYIETFILVEDPASCPFCGSDTYGPVLEVHLKRPIGNLVEFTELTVEGRIELIEDPGTYQSYRMVDAIPR